MPERLAGPPVRPEFRPTLPELLGPRLRRLSRVGVALLALAGVALVALVVVLGGGGGAATQTVVVRQPVAFNLVYDGDRLERAAAPTAQNHIAAHTCTSRHRARRAN